MDRAGQDRQTFHDVEDASILALLDDGRAERVVLGVHAVDDLVDLRQLQVLHEAVVQDGRLDQFPRSATQKKTNANRQPMGLSNARRYQRGN